MFTNLKFAIGTASPFGATVLDNGINFAIPSDNATAVNILLYEQPWSTIPTVVPLIRDSDGVWHRFVCDLPNGTLYNLQVDGPYTPSKDGNRFNPNKALIDPWAAAVVGDSNYDELGALALGYDNSNPNDPDRHLIMSRSKSTAPKCVAFRSNFDWEGIELPKRSFSRAVIYESHLAGMTRDADSRLGDLRGTYVGYASKIEYLQKLGPTHVEFLPVAEFDRYDREQPDCRLMNEWGYQTTVYGAPHSHYSFFGKLGQQVDEFKYLVRELHRAGIAVILDVVFNHDRESNQLGATVSLRGLDNKVYFILDLNNPALYRDHSGCGNTINANHPRVIKLIMDMLRRWVTEYKVDGFRFDLAATFAIDVDQTEKAKTAIIEAIENDAVLANIVLIAEPWSCTQYRLGMMSDKRWYEWNGKYRDTVRKFVKGDTGQVADLATRVAGSRDMYPVGSGRGAINFVTCHDGFTLYDLVSYNNKHNELNGENNRDGSNDNFSWNCGWEGHVEDAPLSEDRKKEITVLRRQQMKNFLTLLLLSQGVPMILYGDEMARSNDGNNNVWCQTELNNLNWSQAEKASDMLNFMSTLIAFRKAHNIGGLEGDQGENSRQIVWHGTNPDQADFSDGARFIAWEYLPYDKVNVEGSNVPVYVASNAYWESIPVVLPQGKTWYCIVDTSQPSGSDIFSDDNAKPVGPTFTIPARTTVVFIAK